MPIYSCNEEFLETKPEGSLTIDKFFEFPEDIRMLTRSMYGREWFGYLDKATYLIQELKVGNMMSKEGEFIPYQEGTLTGDNEFLGYAWQSFYGVISRSNQAIRNLNQLELDKDSEMHKAKQETIGECRFFRAYSYYHLAEYWGEVPVVMDNVEEYTNIEIPKIIKKDIYEIIIRDLDDAIEKLPEKASQPFLTKLSAKALLAKVYLSRGTESFGDNNDFEKSKTLAHDVISNAEANGYGLLENYHDLWLLENNNNKESLFAWQWNYVTPWTDWGIQNTLQSYFAPSDFTASWDGWSSTTPAIDLSESWEEGDKRRYSTQMEHNNFYPEFWREEGGYTYDAFTCNYGGPTPTLSNARKHLAGKNYSSDGNIAEMHTECYTPKIRLADLYLTYAEATIGKQESTSDALAIQYFNTIRTRAGLPGIQTITYNDLYNERRHEFAIEFVNWNDFLRYHRINPDKAEEMLKNQERGYYTVDDSNQSTLVSTKLQSVSSNFFVLPYPSSEVLINPLLKENGKPFDFDKYL